MTGLLALSALLWLHAPVEAQQRVDFQTQLDTANAELEQLDSRAGACLAAFETESTESATVSCKLFLAALDGAELANYLASCALLKQWRDDFVATAQQPDDRDQDDAGNLRLMVGIEYSCGEGALQKRTEFVSSAFNLLYGDQSLSQQSGAALSRRLAELRFETTRNNQRRLLQDSIEQQQSIRLRQTERQFDDLEKEIIRLQIQ
jgi:hypothetical protein